MEPKSRELLYSLLGPLPSRDRPLSCQLVSSVEMDGWILDTLRLDLNGAEPVPAYLARPQTPGPHPAILYNHYHGGEYATGKREFVQKNTYLLSPYAELLARRGIVSLCIDHIHFGERRGRSESSLFKELLWHGKVLWGLMVYDSLKALDYLVSREDVDPCCLGTLGLSMGSTMAWWVAALDERVKVCVDLCCKTDFDELIAQKGLDEHGLYYFVPGLLNHFSTSDINALICPRWHLSLNGDFDSLTPVRGLEKINAELQALYQNAGVPERWRMVRERCAHMETAFMRKEILAFLDQAL
jgi:hypothetical protein